MRRGDNKPGRSFNTLLLTYLLMVLILSGVLTGTSYLLLFFFGILPGMLLTIVTSPFGIIVMLILFAIAIAKKMGYARFRPINDTIHAIVCQRDSNVGFAAAEGEFHTLSLNKTLIVEGLQTQHQFTKSNDSCHFCISFQL